MLLQGLGYAIGFSYADAKLTSNFSLPADNGTGTIVPGLLAGKSGEEMPGSPKTSVSAALSYDTKIAQGYDLALSLNGVYRTAVKMQRAPTLGAATVEESTSYGILNASATVNHNPWRYTAYVTNLLDKQEILVPPTQVSAGNNFSKLADDYVVNPPRQIGLRVAMPVGEHA